VSNFYRSKEWIRLRTWALKKYGRKCRSCGSTCDIEVDHILPRSHYPRLKLNKDNVQILCSPCNKVKSNVYVTDYRPLHWKLHYLFLKAVRASIWPTIIMSGVFYGLVLAN